MSDVTVDHVKAFARNMFKQPMFIQTLVQGNIIPDEAKEMFEMICKAFNVRHHSIFFVQVGHASSGNQHFSLYHVHRLPTKIINNLRENKVIFHCLKLVESL